MRVDNHLINGKPVINNDILLAFGIHFIELTLSSYTWRVEVYSLAYLHVHRPVSFELSHLISKKCTRDGLGQRFWNFFNDTKSPRNSWRIVVSDCRSHLNSSLVFFIQRNRLLLVKLRSTHWNIRVTSSSLELRVMDCLSDSLISVTHGWWPWRVDQPRSWYYKRWWHLIIINF